MKDVCLYNALFLHHYGIALSDTTNASVQESENLALLRIGYIFSRTSYYLKFLYKYILK